MSTASPQRQPRLTIRNGGRLVRLLDLRERQTTIGRRADNAIHLDDPAASGLHATLTLEPDPYLEGCTVTYLLDMGSTNGTWLNGERVTRKALRHGDSIRIGQHELLYEEEVGVMDRTVYLLPDDPT